MELYVATVGQLQENCYFLVGDNNRDTIIFDPGAEPDTLKNVIEENELNPIAIVLTHAHYDHIGALNEIRDAYEIPVYQNPIEKEWLVDPVQNDSGNHPGMENIASTQPADVYLEEMGPYSIGEFHFDMQHIPGHSPGSTVFIFKDSRFAIVGDVIFKGSVGRSDFPYGDHESLIAGIHKHIAPLPGDTVLFPGHGDATTVKDELNTNPFLTH